MSHTPFLVRHLNGENGGRFPVWLMRQAGRYLPDYREIRKSYSFWEMVSQPDIAARVSLMPLEFLKVDAVIFFSDILTLPYGMDIPISMKESIGPVVETPLRSERAFEIFKTFDPAKHTDFVSEAMQKTRRGMPQDVTLIGFAGSPWTVGCYLVEGQGKNGFPSMIEWMNRDPKSLIAALEHLSDATVVYLKSQLKAGAHMLQVFDTWLGSMSMSFYREHYGPLLERLIATLKAENVPLTYFAKGAKPFLSEFKSLSADTLGVETNLTFAEVEAATEKKFSLQGNFSPEVLHGDIATVRRLTREMVQEARKLAKPPIMNLGHGVLPTTPVENVQAFVNEARAMWI